MLSWGQLLDRLRAYGVDLGTAEEHDAAPDGHRLTLRWLERPVRGRRQPIRIFVDFTSRSDPVDSVVMRYDLARLMLSLDEIDELLATPDP